MKRSQINALIDDAIVFIESHGFKIPPFAFWSEQDWKLRQPDSQEIKNNMLGWDVTDFGCNDFKHRGLVLLTIRNGNQHNPTQYPKPYAEKLLIADENQETPVHFHWSKMEDIINRGGGDLVVELWNSNEKAEKLGTRVDVSIDGTVHTFGAGERIVLHPGQSITLVPGQYHRFYAKEGTGKVLLGEVSAVNDDNTDNRFFEELPRFPKVEDDEPIRHLLVTDY